MYPLGLVFAFNSLSNAVVILHDDWNHTCQVKYNSESHRVFLLLKQPVNVKLVSDYPYFFVDICQNLVQAHSKELSEFIFVYTALDYGSNRSFNCYDCLSDSPLVCCFNPCDYTIYLLLCFFKSVYD